MDKKFTFTKYLPASQIWDGAKDHEDKGLRKGLLRGYNIELRKTDGTTFWLSCCYMSNTPEEYFNDDFYYCYFKDYGWTPTGRICFRGYGISLYDSEEGDWGVKSVEDPDSFVSKS